MVVGYEPKYVYANEEKIPDDLAYRPDKVTFDVFVDR